MPDHRHLALGYLLGALQVLIDEGKKVPPGVLEGIRQHAEWLVIVESNSNEREE